MRGIGGTAVRSVMGLRLLVVEGNTRQARELHESISGKMPGRAYADTLMSLAPDAVCDICFPADEGANLPDGSGVESYDGVVLTGSSLNIYDGSREVARQLDLARTIYAAGVPFLGSCWGLQIASAAARGDVEKNPLRRETRIGRNIAPTAARPRPPVLAG